MSNVAQDLMHAHLGMLLWALIVGLSFPVLVLMSEGLPPLLLTAVSFAIAALRLQAVLNSFRPSTCDA